MGEFADLDELDGFHEMDDFGDDNREEIECKFMQIARETKAAYLITFEIDAEFKPVQAWLPKSQVTISMSRPGIIFIPRWLVEDKELESYEK